MPLQFDDYEVLETIGNGSFGCCKKVRRKSDRKIFAWKEVDYSLMTEPERRMLTNEVNALRNLSHPHIIRYAGHIVDKVNRILYIVTEYCEGGDLSSMIKNCKRTGTVLSEDFIWRVMCQTLHALWECHDVSKRGHVLLHRDVKPANVFMTNKKDVKLGDFGMARLLPSTSAFARTYLGSPIYMSPELVNNKEYNDKSDIWGLGCLLYELCALIPPFTAGSMSQLIKRITEGKVDRIPSRYSDELDTIVRKMLTVKAERRPSADLILNRAVVTSKCYQLNLKWSSDSAKSLEEKAKELASKEKKLLELERALGKKEKQLEKVENELMDNEVAKKERMLREREKAHEKNKMKLEKQEMWLNLQAKLLEERTVSIEQYANVFKHLGLHHGQLPRGLQDPPSSKHPHSATSSSHSSSNYSQNLAPVASLGSANSGRTTLKHVHFQVKERPLHEEDVRSARRAPSSANKENLPVNKGPQPNMFSELKASLNRANRKALQLRLTEMESRMRLSPFI